MGIFGVDGGKKWGEDCGEVNGDGEREIKNLFLSYSSKNFFLQIWHLES